VLTVIRRFSFASSSLAHITNSDIQKDGVRGGAVGWGTAATSQEVAGSIPDSVIGIYH
jgi:hypothetical protein